MNNALRRRNSLGRRILRALSGATLAILANVPVLGSAARAADEMVFEVAIKNHKFEPEELKLPAGAPIKLSVKNLDASPEEFESTDLGFEKVIAGNSQAIVRLKPLKPGVYIFFGEYHPSTALGHVIVE
jgi:plastocyanin